MLKNTANNYVKGESFEKEVSKRFHRDSTPVLVSSKVLRQFGMGQVDLARIKNGILEIAEVKYSQRLGARQAKRLLASADYIGKVLGLSVKFNFIHKEN